VVEIADAVRVSFSPELLPGAFNTPNSLFYVRNHLPVPVIDPKEYQLEIAIEGTGLSLPRFPLSFAIETHSVAALERQTKLSNFLWTI
jgi:hypothetical protein